MVFAIIAESKYIKKAAQKLYGPVNLTWHNQSRPLKNLTIKFTNTIIFLPKLICAPMCLCVQFTKIDKNIKNKI